MMQCLLLLGLVKYYLYSSWAHPSPIFHQTMLQIGLILKRRLKWWFQMKQSVHLNKATCFFPSLKYTALLPTIAGYQLSPPENKTFIFQLWLYILKAFCCVFVPLTLVIVLPYLLGLGCYFGEVISIWILSGDNWYPAIIGSKAVYTTVSFLQILIEWKNKRLNPLY